MRSRAAAQRAERVLRGEALARSGISQFKAGPQAREAAAHPGLHRAERLTQVLRELGMRQAVVEGKRDRLALPGV
jgi:hypothetical protein